LKHRALELGARLVDLLPEADDFDFVQLGPVGDLLALYLGRDEGLALTTRPPADADVAVRRLWFARRRRLVNQLEVCNQPDGYRIELIERSAV
jgi:hypothetical protein